MKREEILRLFAGNIRKILELSGLDFEKMQEIRLRVDQPLILIYEGKEVFLDPRGRRLNESSRAVIVHQEDLKETLEYISDYSIYAYEDELKQGFITVQGGHRVGVAGKTLADGEHIRGMKYISCLNVRISHQIKGCADEVLPYLFGKEGICHTLIISAPRCGKTTILRDLVRQLSNGVQGHPGYTVGVVDERSEIGGCYMGIPQNDIGMRTDLLDCCPKAEGMMMLIRSMAPGIVAVDELGSYSDIHAIESVIHCGCKLLATVHGTSVEDIQRKPLFQKLIQDHVFERYIVLHSREQIGKVKAVFDARGTCIMGAGTSFR